MRTRARFDDPSELTVVVTLTGTLKEFEELHADLINSKDVSYYRTANLLRSIEEAARRIRSTVEAAQPDE